MIDLDDTAAIASYGHAGSDTALLADIADAMPGAVLGDFVRALDMLERAVSTIDPAHAKRAVGWIGRMLGDDIQAQADGDQLRERMGVLLGDARLAAARVETADARLAFLASQLADVIARIDADVDAGHAQLAAHPTSTDPNGPIERFRRRLLHLSTLAASHRTTREHLQLARTQCARLLERHAALDQLLGAVWTQHRIATRGP